MSNKLFTKNFSLLLLGQAVSLFGNCVLDFALSMCILEMTGSAAVFAGFLALAMLPTILLSPLGGVLADRADKRKIMVSLDFMAGAVTVVTVLLLGKGNDLSIIGAAIVAQSVLGAFETPTVQACVPQMLTGNNIVRGNAAVNQISAVSSLTAPFIGSMLYTSFGLKPVMYAGAVCFFITALFECFIKLQNIQQSKKESILMVIRNDLTDSVRFIRFEKPCILKTLLLVTVIAFFIQGTAMVGFPYIVRTILGLSANYYGAAVSVLSCASILGSIAAGLLAARFKIRNLYLAVSLMGVFLLPAGSVFFSDFNIYIRYFVLVLSFFMIQIAACIFTVFALSIIQQVTPGNMIGKIMAFAASFSLCAQPLGQIIYGGLFDEFSNMIYIVLIPTAVILMMAGWFSRSFFNKVEQTLKPDC